MNDLDRTEQMEIIKESKPSKKKKQKRNYTRWYMILTIISIIVKQKGKLEIKNKI